MASNFPNPTENNPVTSAPWAAGDTWTDPSSNATYVYEPDGSAAIWKTIGTSASRYVEVDGDAMTGNLTLGPDGGTPVITLNATNGDVSTARFFCGNIQASTSVDTTYQYRAIYNGDCNFTVTNQGAFFGGTQAFNGNGSNAQINAEGVGNFVALNSQNYNSQGTGLSNTSYGSPSGMGFGGFGLTTGVNNWFIASGAYNGGPGTGAYVHFRNSFRNKSERCGMYFGAVSISSVNQKIAIGYLTANAGDAPATLTETVQIAEDGTITPASVVFNLEPDNEDNYTTTTEEYTETESYTGPLGNTLEREVTKTRDIRTYTGPMLDVKAVIQELQQRVAARDAVIADFTARLAALEANTLQPLYSTTADLPSASEHHGKTAHVHSEGALYFAHAGNWIKLQNA